MAQPGHIGEYLLWQGSGQCAWGLQELCRLGGSQATVQLPNRWEGGWTWASELGDPADPGYGGLAGF